MKNKTIVWMSAMILVAIAFGSFQYMSTPDQQQQAAMNGPAKTPVTTLTMESEVIDMTIELPGRTAAFTQSQVRPQVSGIIKERLFEEGSMVEKGQQLYQLDAARYEANLKSALANLQSVKANAKAVEAKYKRVLSLIEKSAVSQQDLDDVEAQLDQSKAAIAVAEAAVLLEKINVDYSKVYAPISGRIGRSNLTEGALVTASQAEALATITQLDPIYVDMQVSESDSISVQQKLNAGQTIEVFLNGDSTKGAKGTLAFSDVMVNETTGSVALRAVMDNEKGGLLPGLFVNATISLGEQEGLLLPQRATVREPSGDLVVWVVDQQNKAQPQTIQVSGAQGAYWVVKNGLKPGDQIVVEGYQKLSPGSEVMTSAWQPIANTAQNKNRG